MDDSLPDKDNSAPPSGSRLPRKITLLDCFKLDAEQRLHHIAASNPPRYVSEAIYGQDCGSPNQHQDTLRRMLRDVQCVLDNVGGDDNERQDSSPVRDQDNTQN